MIDLFSFGFFDQSFCQRACLTLMHSLWQMTFLLVVAWGINRSRLVLSPQQGYLLHVTALLIGLAALPVTFVMLKPAETTTVAAQLAAFDEDLFAEEPTAPVMPLPVATQQELLPQQAVTPQSQPNIAANSASTPSVWPRLTPWLTGLYLLGVVIMAMRLLLGIVQVDRLSKQAEPIISGPAFDSLRSLARRWSLHAAPVLAQTQQIVVPKVVGLLRPTILLPTSALTGLTASELEMILAHELAHVRRHDMWLHLVQRLAEVALFFNPALWLLSQQISKLREYCCDELACDAIEAKEASETAPEAARLSYAQALLRVVELSSNGQGNNNPANRKLVALAASGRSPSELRRRVARLFGEPMREPVRMSRGGVLTVALLIAAMFFLASPSVWNAQAEPNGSQAKIESEEPTPEAKETDAESKPEKTVDKTPAKLSGKIVLEDGSPADAKGWLYSDATVATEQSTSSYSSLEGDFSDKFSCEVHAGIVWLSYFPKGYAPTWIGPLELKPGEARDDLRLVLEPGFSTRVRLTDEQGQIVPGATVVAHPEIDGSCGGPIRKQTTNAKGELLLTHLAKTRYQLTITAPGFQPLHTAPLRVEANEMLRPTMVRSVPSTGIVRFADGTPAPFSKLRCKFELREDGREQGYGNDGDGFWGQTLFKADATGRFKLDQLSTGSRYLFIVEAVDGARAIVTDLQAGQEGVQIVLPRRRDLLVRISGDVSKLTKRKGKPFVSVRQPISMVMPDHRRGDLIGDDLELEPVVENGKTILQGIFRGLAVDLSPDAEKQMVDVSLGYDHQTKKSVELNLTGGTAVEFTLQEAEKTSTQPAKPPTKPTADDTETNAKATKGIVVRVARLIAPDDKPSMKEGDRLINWTSPYGKTEKLLINTLEPPLLVSAGVKSARAEAARNEGYYQVLLELTPEAATQMRKTTAKLMADSKPGAPFRLAMLLDDQVLMAPTLRSTLSDQIAITSGDMKDEKQAKELARKIGPPPVEVPKAASE